MASDSALKSERNRALAGVSQRLTGRGRKIENPSTFKEALKYCLQDFNPTRVVRAIHQTGWTLEGHINLLAELANNPECSANERIKASTLLLDIKGDFATMHPEVTKQIKATGSFQPGQAELPDPYKTRKLQLAQQKEQGVA